MTGDGTNDAPALAQADVGVAMNTGTSAAKEAGNMVDLDSNPTKLIEIVAIGKQLLITRGALTTFSIANDVAKYFAIIPAMFVSVFPGLQTLNVMKLHSSQSAILSAVIFNAIIIVMLIPLALRGVKYRPQPAADDAPSEPRDLRARRRDRAVHRDQARGPDRHRVEAGLMRRHLLAGLRMLVILTVLLGVIYPLAVTGISQLTMSHRANGSLVRSDGTVVGSELLAQAFEGDEWFQPRPGSYDPTASGASNLGPNNPDLIDTVRERGRRGTEAGRRRRRDADPCGRRHDQREQPRPGHHARVREAAGATRRGRPGPGRPGRARPHRSADRRADLRVPRRPAGQRPPSQPRVGTPSVGP